MCCAMILLLYKHGRRRSSWLSNAPLDMEHDNNRDHRDIASDSSFKL